MTDSDPFGPDKPDQAKQSEPKSEWVYLGCDDVSEKTRRINPPDAIYEEVCILEKGRPAHWSYDKITGTVIVSNAELEEPEYNTVGSNKVLDEKNEHQITVPWQFFNTFDRVEEPEGVPSGARMELEERYHFVYHEGLEMHRGEKRSCFLFTDGELMDRVKDASNLSREFNSAPQFL